VHHASDIFAVFLFLNDEIVLRTLADCLHSDLLYHVYSICLMTVIMIVVVVDVCC